MNSLVKAVAASVQLKRALGCVHQGFVHARQVHRLGERRGLTCKPGLPGRRHFHEDKQFELDPISGSPIPFKVLCRLSFLWSFRRFLYLPKVPIGPNVTIGEFIEGMKNAQCIVSEALADADFDALDELVTEEEIEKLRLKIGTMSPHQRRLLRIKEENINRFDVCTRPKSEDSRGDIEVEATVVYYPEFLSLDDKEDKPLPQYNFIGHYIFTRRQETDPWIISSVNHSSFVSNWKMLWSTP